MLICSVKPKNVNSEKEAIALADVILDLTDEVTSMTNRYQRTNKIKLLAAKMDHFRKRCVRKGWQSPLDMLLEAFEMIEEAKVEGDNYINHIDF